MSEWWMRRFVGVVWIVIMWAGVLGCEIHVCQLYLLDSQVSKCRTDRKPYACVIEKGPKKRFSGGAFTVESYVELERYAIILSQW